MAAQSCHESVELIASSNIVYSMQDLNQLQQMIFQIKATTYCAVTRPIVFGVVVVVVVVVVFVVTVLFSLSFCPCDDNML